MGYISGRIHCMWEQMDGVLHFTSALHFQLQLQPLSHPKVIWLRQTETSSRISWTAESRTVCWTCWKAVRQWSLWFISTVKVLGSFAVQHCTLPLLASIVCYTVRLFIYSSVVATVLHPPSFQPTLDGGCGQRSGGLMMMMDLVGIRMAEAGENVTGPSQYEQMRNVKGHRCHCHHTKLVHVRIQSATQSY